VDDTMKHLFEQFGWQGHLPLDSVRTPPIAKPSVLQAL
ncbi:MAG: pseudouridylate synthase, partial [Halomonas sp.]|nr:pseudouridylate synthase [Halomonas sp.]